jgi:hypothetical protein
MKMMVMALACPLVARGLARDVDGCQPAGLEQPAQRPVNGGDTQSGTQGLRPAEDLLRSQRSIRLEQGLPDRLTLFGFSFHG